MSAFHKTYDDIYDDNEVTGIDIAVYQTLCSFADNITGKCFPSVSALAEKSRFSKSSVIRAIKHLIERGHIVKDKGDNKHSNTYYIVAYQKAQHEKQKQSVSPTPFQPPRLDMHPEWENQDIQPTKMPSDELEALKHRLGKS